MTGGDQRVMQLKAVGLDLVKPPRLRFFSAQCGVQFCRMCLHCLQPRNLRLRALLLCLRLGQCI